MYYNGDSADGTINLQKICNVKWKGCFDGLQKEERR